MGDTSSYTIKDINRLANEILNEYRHDKNMQVIKIRELINSLPVNISQKVTSKNGYYFILPDETEELDQ